MRFFQLYLHLKKKVDKQFTFFVLRDLLSTLALGPLTLGLLLLPVGKALVDGGLEEVLMEAVFFSPWLFLDGTLLFSLKDDDDDDFLSSAAPMPKSMGCPLLMSSR